MSKFREFYRTNSRYFTKFWGNQFFTSILGIMITTAMERLGTTLGNSWITLLFAVLFCGGFFCFLVYDASFQLGAKNFTKVKNGEAVADKLRGLKLTLFAYAPTLLIVLLSVIFEFSGLSDASGVTKIILVFIIHAMYSGLVYLFPDGQYMLAIVVSVFPALVAGFLGYYLAMKDKTLRGLLGFHPKQNRE